MIFIINILLIVIAIFIVIIPIKWDLATKKNKVLTKYGVIFICLILLTTILQVKKELINKEEDSHKDKINKSLIDRSDSLNVIIKSLNDTVLTLRKMLLTIDVTTKITSDRLKSFHVLNESLNTKVLESDRPQITFYSANFIEEKINDKNVIAIEFANIGKRSATNIYGNEYLINSRDYRLNDLVLLRKETFMISRKDIIGSNMVIKIREPFIINPYEEDMNFNLFYYFGLKYSDILSNKEYSFEIALRVPSFKKGKFYKEFGFIKDWEQMKIKTFVSNK
jgi:hypothetical protein